MTKKGGLSVDDLTKDTNWSGPTTDISRFGICLEDGLEKIHSGEPQLTIMVSGHGERFRMHIKSSWSVLDGCRNSSGGSGTEPLIE